MHKWMYMNAHKQDFLLFCSGLEKMNEVELKKKDPAKLEEIFHLLVDSAKVSTTAVNSSPQQSPIPLHPADRSVVQTVLIKCPT